MGQESAEELGVVWGCRFLNGEERVIHAWWKMDGLGDGGADGVGEGLIGIWRGLGETRVFGQQVVLEVADKLVEEAWSEFEKEDPGAQAEALARSGAG